MGVNFTKICILPQLEYFFDKYNKDECRRNHVLQMHGSKLSFPMVRKTPLVEKKLRRTFNTKRPTTLMQ